MVVVHPSTIQIVNVETESESGIGIDGKIRLEAFFTTPVIETLVVGKVGKRRQGIRESHILRFQYRLVVWVGKEELAFFLTVEEDT